MPVAKSQRFCYFIAMCGMDWGNMFSLRLKTGPETIVATESGTFYAKDYMLKN